MLLAVQLKCLEAIQLFLCSECMQSSISTHLIGWLVVSNVPIFCQFAPTLFLSMVGATGWVTNLPCVPLLTDPWVQMCTTLNLTRVIMTFVGKILPKKKNLCGKKMTKQQSDLLSYERLLSTLRSYILDQSHFRLLLHLQSTHIGPIVQCDLSSYLYSIFI